MLKKIGKQPPLKLKSAKIYTKPGGAPSRTGRTGARGSRPGRAAAAWPQPGILYISCICLYIFEYVGHIFNIRAWYFFRHG